MSEPDRVFVERKCIDCGENTYNPERCRECNLERHFKSMTCSVCEKMHTVRPDAEVWKNGFDPGALANALWGNDHRCECPEPKPPTMLHATDSP